MGILKQKQEIRKKIKQHTCIFVVGHKNLDLDAIGSALGIYAYVKKYRKKCYIIDDDKVHELGVSKIIQEQNPSIFIKSDEIENIKGKSNLLIVVDTNKENLLHNKEILNMMDNVIIIDHHQPNKYTIKNALMVLDLDASSACEMVTELLYSSRIKVSSKVATAILSGIVLDTNNFVLKTDAKTYYAAYYLASLGASTKKVQYYLKQDIKDYIIRQQVITDVEVIDDKYAITTGNEKIKYKREGLAKIATTLLHFSGIEASFVIGKNQDNNVGVSARSDGSLNVGKLMEKLGGGGDDHEAAAQIENESIESIKEKIYDMLK